MCNGKNQYAKCQVDPGLIGTNLFSKMLPWCNMMSRENFLSPWVIILHKFLEISFWSMVPLNKIVMMHHLSGYAILQFYGIMVFYWPVSLRACSSTGHVDCVHHNHTKWTPISRTLFPKKSKMLSFSMIILQSN